MNPIPSGIGTCRSNARADLMSASEKAPTLPEWPGWAQNGSDWPEADCLLLVATYGEAETHHKILVRSFRPIAAVHRTTAERRDLTRSRHFVCPGRDEASKTKAPHERERGLR